MRVKSKSLAGWCVVALLSADIGAAAGVPPLVEAAKNKDKDGVRNLLQQRADVNLAAPDGATPLHWAVHWDDLDLSDRLIRAGANVNAVTDLGITALSLACVNGNEPMIEKLLKTGANPNIVSSTGESPLMTATRTSSMGAVKALLAHGANVNAKENSREQTALMWAVAMQRSDVVGVLLEHGADIHARSKVIREIIVRDDKADQGRPTPEEEILDKGGSTALLFAAREGDVDSAKLLVAAGASVNEVAPDGMSVLVMAAYSKHPALAAFLLDKDADPNADGAGVTALHVAVLTGDLDLVKILLAHGANPNARLKKGTPVTRFGEDHVLPGYLVGSTPFLVAAKFLQVNVMLFLAANGANPLLTTTDGTTALMEAADRRLMANRSVDPSPRGLALGSSGAPPRDESRLATIRLALELGVDVNAANLAGDTALHFAASRGSDGVIRLLVDKGARLDVKNKGGQTPLSEVGTHKSTANLLKKLGATE
jgi:ankyrin repeat protein